MRNILCLFSIAMIIGCVGPTRDYYIGGKYAFSDNQIIKVKKTDRGVVTETVIDYVVHTYNYDNEEKFIIAYQVPVIATTSVRPSDAYWIIDIEHERVLGPMTLQKFQQDKKRLHINLEFQRDIGSSEWRAGRLEISGTGF
ncbi:MAG: DUF3997 domain-containing protein [Prevotella sp.]|nr:DUF3997 domain-containing protein [Prevotella sp.]